MFHIIILNWNWYEETIACVDSIIGSVETPHTITIVDNDSSGNDFDILSARYGKMGDISMVRSASNLWFSGGNNLWLRWLVESEKIHDGDIVTFLNNDTEIENDFLKPLSEAFEQRKDAWAAQSLLVYHHVPELINNYGQQYSINGLSFDLWFKENVETFRKDHPEKILDIPVATGCSLSIRWSVIQKIASNKNGWELWDTSYFLYGEDTDLSMRIRSLGYTCILAKDSVVRHKVSVSTKKMGDLSLYHFYKNLSQTYLKNLSGWELIKYWPAIIVMELVSLPYTMIQWKARVWLSAKWWVLKNLGAILSKRRQIQRTKVSNFGGEFVNRWRPSR